MEIHHVKTERVYLERGTKGRATFGLAVYFFLKRILTIYIYFFIHSTYRETCVLCMNSVRHAAYCSAKSRR